MPFKNKSQQRACYAQRSQALKSGKRPEWDCEKYGKHKSKNEKRKSYQKKSTRKKSMTKKERKVYTGPRGGKYIKYKTSTGNVIKVYV